MRFGQNKADKIQFVSVDKLFFGKQIPVKECMEDNFFEEIDTGQDEASRVSMFVFLPPTESNALDKLLARLISSPDILCEVANEGISAPRRHEDPQIGEVLLKSKITINEEGTTVASATVEFSFRSSRPDDPAMFDCNHPCIFVI
ncbi:hypothetical protein pipiens_015296 [Culex pipiens pipiens]|uniref:Serpin domain-containing protein n=1 Tax=Culex pipiens pipiens TaxID=38569 RepID=A0ABD1CR39_CULPP